MSRFSFLRSRERESFILFGERFKPDATSLIFNLNFIKAAKRKSPCVKSGVRFKRIPHNLRYRLELQIQTRARTFTYK